MTRPSEAVILATYARLKRENPRLPEGEVLDRVSRLLGIARANVGEVLREQPTIKRYAVICRHKNSPFGGN